MQMALLLLLSCAYFTKAIRVTTGSENNESAQVEWKRTKDKYTSRGGAVHQSKNWVLAKLPEQTRFIHCGSAPTDAKGLLLKFAKEKITIPGNKKAPKKYILAYPYWVPVGKPLEPEAELAKPCQVLWDVKEMPNCFVFVLPKKAKVYCQHAAKNNCQSGMQEVGIPQNIMFKKTLRGIYKRTGMKRLTLQ
jgi:hypothetical protein